MGSSESPRSFASAWRIRSSSGFWNGRPLRKRSLIKLKMAVFIPIPSARVSTARKVNAGDLRSCRRAKRRSIIGSFYWMRSFGAESDDGIDARGAAGGQPRSERYAEAKNDDGAEPD